MLGDKKYVLKQSKFILEVIHPSSPKHFFLSLEQTKSLLSEALNFSNVELFKIEIILILSGKISRMLDFFSFFFWLILRVMILEYIRGRTGEKTWRL